MGRWGKNISNIFWIIKLNIFNPLSIHSQKFNHNLDIKYKIKYFFFPSSVLSFTIQYNSYSKVILKIKYNVNQIIYIFLFPWNIIIFSLSTFFFIFTTGTLCPFWRKLIFFFVYYILLNPVLFFYLEKKF